MSKKRADEYYKKKEEEKRQSRKKAKRRIDASKSRDRSEESKKDEGSGNWFTNLFLFCGSSSCCTSKATQNEKGKMESQYGSPTKSEAAENSKDFQSLNGSMEQRNKLSRHTAHAKLKQQDTSQLQDSKSARRAERYTTQTAAQKDKRRQRKKQIDAMMSEKDLIFSNSSQDEPQNLDMKKMKQQRKAEKEKE